MNINFIRKEVNILKKPTKKEFHRWVKTAEELTIELISLAGWIKILIDTIKGFFN